MQSFSFLHSSQCSIVLLHKIYTPSFTGGKLSYILFCHNDTACPVNNKVYWTSGFYNHIKIYDLESLTILNDNSFYDQYIYNNYYSYYNYQKSNDRFDSYPLTKEIIKMKLGDMVIKCKCLIIELIKLFH